MNKKINKYLEENWEILKGKLKQKWGKLTDDDILQIGGSYNELYGKLKKLYQDKADDLENEITEFLSKYGFKGKDIEENINLMKDTIFEYMDEYFQNVKSKSADIEKKTTQSIKENPFKWLGAAALGGFILAKLII